MAFDSSMFERMMEHRKRAPGMYMAFGSVCTMQHQPGSDIDFEVLADGAVQMKKTIYYASVLKVGGCLIRQDGVNGAWHIHILTGTNRQFDIAAPGSFRLLDAGDVLDRDTGQVLGNSIALARPGPVNQAAAAVPDTDDEEAFEPLTEADVLSETEAAPEGEDCAVCCARPKGSVLLIPCQHAQLCMACAWQAKLKNECPTCRAAIVRVGKLLSC